MARARDSVSGFSVAIGVSRATKLATWRTDGVHRSCAACALIRSSAGAETRTLVAGQVCGEILGATGPPSSEPWLAVNA
jgi:hypothetical protein